MYTSSYIIIYSFYLSFSSFLLSVTEQGLFPNVSSHLGAVMPKVLRFCYNSYYMSFSNFPLSVTEQGLYPNGSSHLRAVMPKVLGFC